MNEVVICTSVKKVPYAEQRAVWKTWRWEGGILSAYIFLVLAETIFIRQSFIGQHFQPELFWSWRVWNVQRGQIIANVIMFVPVGVLSGLLWKWKGVFVAAGLSLGIEILQLVTSRGLCELDDVIHNMIGALIGVGVVMIGRKCLKGKLNDRINVNFQKK
jgi:hypothetical protein